MFILLFHKDINWSRYDGEEDWLMLILKANKTGCFYYFVD